jgi:hypothetical protein
VATEAERRSDGRDREYTEILTRLSQLQASKGERVETPPFRDPTENVLLALARAEQRQDDLRKAGFRRLDDLRKQESYWRTQLAKSERGAAANAALAESRRVDALLAAAAAERARERQTAETTASALAERVDAAQKALAESRGGKEQRTEGRLTGQWVTGLAIAGLAILELALRLSGR